MQNFDQNFPPKYLGMLPWTAVGGGHCATPAPRVSDWRYFRLSCTAGCNYTASQLVNRPRTSLSSATYVR